MKKPDVRYYVKGKKKAVAGSSRDTYYTMVMLKDISSSWDNLYRKLDNYPNEKAVFDLYRGTGVSWNDLKIIAGVRT